MKFFAGIDGGQSSTVALIGDETGAVLGRGTAGPCDWIGQAAESPRFARALESAIGEALRAAALPAETHFETIVAGISGYEGTIHGLEPKLNAQSVRYLHDARVAHAGAFELGEGIVVIAGTGSVALGRDASGREAVVGGWGFLFGDEGSAFRDRTRGSRVAMRAQDAAGHSEIEERARRFFGRSDCGILRVDSIRVRSTVRRWQRLRRPCLRLHTTTTRMHWPSSTTQRKALAALTATCAERLVGALRLLDVALCGGTFASEWFRTRVASSYRRGVFRRRASSRHAGIRPPGRCCSPSRWEERYERRSRCAVSSSPCSRSAAPRWRVPTSLRRLQPARSQTARSAFVSKAYIGSEPFARVRETRRSSA